MIGGDLVLEKVSSNPLIEPPLDPAQGRPRSLLQYNESLKRFLTLPVDIIYTGHGNEVRNAHELIESRLVKQRERAMKVLAMMDDGSRTIFELTRELFPAVYEKELGLTLSETIGQTDYLVDEGLSPLKHGMKAASCIMNKRKSILITGATSGVGYALTKRLLAEGQKCGRQAGHWTVLEELQNDRCTYDTCGFIQKRRR